MDSAVSIGAVLKHGIISSDRVKNQMSRAEREFDRGMRAKLEALRGKLAGATEELRRAGNIAAPRATSTAEVLAELQQALQECQAVVRDHGMATIRASDETLAEVGHTLGEAHEVLGALADYLDVTRGHAQG